MSDALVGGEKEAPALTNVEIEILQSASEEKIRKIEQDAANRVHLETRLETMIQSCLAVKANTQLYTDVFRRCAAVTDIIADGVSVQKQTDDLAVRYVNALLGYTDLQTYYSQKIESLQNKVVNFEIEVQRLETLIQKGIRNDHVPEVALKLACLMKTEKHGETDPLIKILTDLICNRGKESKTWSDETKSLFAIILNYGGAALAKIVRTRLGGPHLSTIYRQSRSSYVIPTVLTDKSFSMARVFYEKIGYTGPFILAIDATTLIATLRVRGNKIIGLATETEVTVSTAQDIIDIVNSESYEKAKLANAFVLSPMVQHAPSFTLCISPVVKGQDYQTVKGWMTQTMEMGSTHNIEILGIGADGDSKFRKHYFQEHKRNDGLSEEQITLDYKGFDFAARTFQTEDCRTCKTMMFPDWRHILKKWRNQLLNVKRILLMGSNIAQIEHLMQTYLSFKLECGLWKSDVYVRDKQNVDAATRLLKPEARHYLKIWNEKASLATRVYLKVGESLFSAFTEKELSVRERAKRAWLPVTFLRLWRAWLKMEGYPTDHYFISGQTYDDVILAGHSIIISMKLYAIYYPELPYEPWMFGSDSCEVLFSSLRGFCRGKPNLTLLDLLDFARRIQKLKEMNPKPFNQLNDKKWPTDMDAELTLGLQEAEKEAIKTAELLGMIASLERANVVTSTKEGGVVLINPTTDVYPLSTANKPDENNILQVEDLLEIENDVLINAIDESENEITTSFINLAAKAKENTINTEQYNENMNEEEGDEEYDDGAPTNCVFYRLGSCRYRESTFRAPKETNWLGCEFPGCNKWFHEVCLGLKFPNDKAREAYTYFCKDHPSAGYASQKKVVSSTEDKDILEKDPLSANKQNRVIRDENGNYRMPKMSTCYVEFNGVYYHIAQFLSLQQGKQYMPATSRNSRWMAVSKVNYYDSIGKISRSQEKEDLICNSFAAFWMGKEGLIIGKVIRMYCNPCAKSAYPILTCDSKDSKSSTVTCCVNVAPVDTETNTWILQVKNRFVWCPMKSLIAKLTLIERENVLEVNGDDVKNILAMLPQLQETEKRRQEEESKEKETRIRKKKEGPPEEMSVALLKEVLKEMGVSFKHNSTKAQLMEKVKEVRESHREATYSHAHSSKSVHSQKTSERSRQNYWNQFRNDTHPLPLWIMYDPQRKRRILIIIILMLILLAFTNMFSELLNVEFLSNLYQLFLFHYLSSALVAEFIIYFVLLIYRMILALICSMIFAAARVLLTKHLLETMSSITTTQLRTS